VRSIPSDIVRFCNDIFFPSLASAFDGSCCNDWIDQAGGNDCAGKTALINTRPKPTFGSSVPRHEFSVAPSIANELIIAGLANSPLRVECK
jgi:hypothetical protein